MELRLRRRPLDFSAFAAWLSSVPGGKMAPTSVQVYRREAKSFVSFAGPPKRKGWTKAQVEGWLGSRDYSSGTAARALGVILKLAEYQGVDDPTKDIPRPKRGKGLPKPVQGLPFILRRMEDDGELDLRWMCMFVASTGLRSGEACFDADNGFTLIDEGRAIRVHGKGSKDRIVPLDDTAKACHAMLTPPHGEFRVPFTQKQFQAATRRYGFWPHQLRHLFGTVTYARTRDLYVVSRLMGHASIETTKGYAELSTDVLYEAMNARTGAPIVAPELALGNGETK